MIRPRPTSSLPGGVAGIQKKAPDSPILSCRTLLILEMTVLLRRNRSRLAELLL